MRLAISVDVDGLEHYRDIHALSMGGDPNLVFARAVPRLVDWARQRHLPLSWFVVGRDLDESANGAAVAALARAGDEIACHSHSHPYELTRLGFAEMRGEIELGVAALLRASGAPVRGFRAPGYVVTDTLLDLLREQGFAYDSSVFPCPSYYALKAGAIAAMQARGKSSRAIIDRPEVLRAPTVPYRVGRPYWFRGTGIWEIPIQVTRRARLPFIGTALTMAGPTGARLLARGVLGERFVNLELHGIDALDEHDGEGLKELAEKQRDLRIPWSRKLEAIDAAVSLLLEKGYRGVRMDELAAAAAAG